MKQAALRLLTCLGIGGLQLGALAVFAEADETGFSCPTERSRTHSQVIRDVGYADMPYMVALPSGKLGMTLTVSDGAEGNDDQHVIWLTSADQGHTWQQMSAIEPPQGPEASWAMPFVFKDKLYVVYLYNASRVKKWPLASGGTRKRVDVIGHIVIRTSDDEGATWSPRSRIAIPESAIDRRNGFKGKHRILWLSGAPVQAAGQVYFGFSKAGVSVAGDIFPDTEAFVLRSATPDDPESWELLPSAEAGFTATEGAGVTEEPSITTLPDGKILVLARTTQGRILQAVSEPGAHAWKTGWASYANGEPLANPRAKAPAFKMRDGRIFLWFHNNGNTDFKNRNPAYISCLEPADPAAPVWAKPQLFLCDERPELGISYPSFLEVGDTLLVAETTKREVRIHRIPADTICTKN